MSKGKRVSFVVRVVQDSHGCIQGVVERVATGAKEAFTGKGAIGPVIVQMLQDGSNLPDSGPGSSGDGDGLGEPPEGHGPRAGS